MIRSIHPKIVMPRALVPGDKIRFVSSASTPNRADVEASVELLESWGYKADIGKHAFNKHAYLAGTDEERLSDFNDALNDSDVRAIFATRGGKGSYRIADRLDFECARLDPKYLVGFSDVTILQMALCNQGVGGGIHGALKAEDWDAPHVSDFMSLKQLLTGHDDVVVTSDCENETKLLTTGGIAEGMLVGGNLDMIATAAGWALPNLNGCLLLIEAVSMYLGQVDRQFSMLIKGGYLDGVAGLALGQFTDIKPSGALTIVDLLREHLLPLGVPILGGLPLGHGAAAQRIAMGWPTVLNADEGTLKVRRVFAK